MEWIDEAIVLSTKKYGESSVIVNLITKKHGKYAGLVRGGAGKRSRGLYQPGNQVNARWRSRLIEHLGMFNCELIQSNAANFLQEPLKLAALSSACALTEFSLPEREKNSEIFLGLKVFISTLEENNVWPMIYVKLELGMLTKLGFGLDLSSCAATGTTENLIYVSPRSGQAVSRSAGAPFHDKLLKLPQILLDPSINPSSSEIYNALKLTGYFFKLHGIDQKNLALPPARQRFIEKFKSQLKRSN